MSLRTRCKLVATLLDGALEGISKKDADMVAELIVVRGIKLVEDTLGIDGDDIIILHPTHSTTRLLSAINDHMIETNEAGDKIVERLIACLGSRAAYAHQPN